MKAREFAGWIGAFGLLFAAMGAAFDSIAASISGVGILIALAIDPTPDEEDTNA